MDEPITGTRVSLTITLSADVARRLKQAAEAEKRDPAIVAAVLLDRYLPRLQTGQEGKGKIPYA